MKLFFRRKRNAPLQPLVSIITPTYNAAETVERTIRSVVQQIYKNIELIFIDGLSEDQTLSIIRAAAEKDPRIRYISEKDHGAYDAMNKGISMYTGDWVYFLGADDELVNDNILQELYDSGYFTQEKVFYGNVIIEGETSWAKDQEVYAGEFDLPMLLKKNICHQAIFYPRHYVKEAGFYNTGYVVCADWDYNMRCYAMEPFLYADKIIARFHSGGISSVKQDTVFGKEFPGNIIRYFKLDPDDPKLVESGTPFRTAIMNYRKIQTENLRNSESIQILITGNPKTGSTALFHSIRNELPENSICLFEPESNGAKLPEIITSPVLVKCFIGKAEAYKHFNRKILITRDPRDQVISQMLYRPFNIVTKSLIIPEDNLKKVLDRLIILLHEKQKNPSGITVREIRELLLFEEAASPQQRLVDYYYNHQEAFIFKYEDYIDRNFDRLNNYLNLKIRIVDDVPERRVIRSKTYGNWKDWFTPADVDYFKVLFGPYMKIFGYDDNWELNPDPVIDPSLSYQYVENLIAEARNNLTKP